MTTNKEEKYNPVNDEMIESSIKYSNFFTLNSKLKQELREVVEKSRLSPQKQISLQKF